MRVGMIAPPWSPIPPLRYGGTEAVVDRLARGIRARGHDVMLWTTGDSTCPVSRGAHFREAEWSRIGSGPVELSHVVRGYDHLDRWSADVVHDHTILGPSIGARWHHAPVVVTVHGPFEDDVVDLWRAVPADYVALSADHAGRAHDLPLTATIHHGIEVDTIPVGD